MKELERIRVVGVKRRRRLANNISVKCKTSLFTKTTFTNFDNLDIYCQDHDD